MKCQYIFLSLLFSFGAYAEANLQKVLNKYQIAGGCYAHLRDGKLSYVSEGTASLHSVVPVNQHTLFRVGSLTSLFTSHVLAQLSIEHRLKLDDPASKFLSRRQNVPHFGSKEITLFELATHTSGLPANAFISNEPALLQSRALYSFLNSHKLENIPGKKIEYSPVGFVLLSAVLTRASKEPMSALIEKIVCRRHGMEDTTYTLTRTLQQTIAFGHIKQQLLDPKHQENRGSSFYDALGLYSSAYDMGQLLQFYAVESKESEPLQNIIFRSETKPMGLKRRDLASGVYELSSRLMGFSGYFIFDREKQEGLVLLLNREDIPIEEIGKELYRAF